MRAEVLRTARLMTLFVMCGLLDVPRLGSPKDRREKQNPDHGHHKKRAAVPRV